MNYTWMNISGMLQVSQASRLKENSLGQLSQWRCVRRRGPGAEGRCSQRWHHLQAHEIPGSKCRPIRRTPNTCSEVSSNYRRRAVHFKSCHLEHTWNDSIKSATRTLQPLSFPNAQLQLLMPSHNPRCKIMPQPSEHVKKQSSTLHQTPQPGIYRHKDHAQLSNQANCVLPPPATTKHHKHCIAEQRIRQHQHHEQTEAQEPRAPGKVTPNKLQLT
jgi:hypothetical protein